MSNQEIPLSAYPTIFTTGATKGILICGIGYNGLNHIGCIIRLLEEIKPWRQDHQLPNQNFRARQFSPRFSQYFKTY
jgi:hypothetical protein